MIDRPLTYISETASDARLCDDAETQAAIQLYERLRADPVYGRAVGYSLRADYAERLSDTVYIETPNGGAGMARVLTIFCPGWVAWSHVAPDRVLWNPLPDGVMVFAYEFFTERRMLH